MRAYVRFLLPDGTGHELSHGDMIGRLASAALYIDDERISEAHALVSLRGRDLRLLALRGRFAVAQSPTSEVVLRSGLEIEVARGLLLGVEDVVLPPSVLALEGDGLPQQVLSSVCSLHVGPRPRLTPRYAGDAAAWIYSTGEGWRLRLPDSPPRALESGSSFTVGERTFRCVSIALEKAAQSPTHIGSGVYRPLRIEARFDTVHIHRPELTLERALGAVSR